MLWTETAPVFRKQAMIKITLESPDDFLIYRDGSGGTVEIFDIVVNSERRKGRGRLLVDTLLKRVEGRVRLVWAITRAENFIAQQFYEKLNFKVVANLRNFYGIKNKEGEETIDAIMYGRYL